jgi:hypothetical protein
MRCAGALAMGVLIWPSLTIAAFIPENQRSTAPEAMTLATEPHPVR